MHAANWRPLSGTDLQSGTFLNLVRRFVCDLEDMSL
jgi:hypothetical protein